MTTITAVVIPMIIMVVTLSMFAMNRTDIVSITKSAAITIVAITITFIITGMMIVRMLSIIVVITLIKP